MLKRIYILINGKRIVVVYKVIKVVYILVICSLYCVGSGSTGINVHLFCKYIKIKNKKIIIILIYIYR